MGAQGDQSRIKREIIITGFGGQGIVLAGRILGKAAALGDHRESTLVQSYGPEARGGECSAQVIISDRPIHYPYVRTIDVLACMSQGGFDKYIGRLKDDGILVIEEDLIRHAGGGPAPCFSIPATAMAEELGRAMMANIILVGFLTAVTGIISHDAARQAVLGEVPKGTEELNLRAFDKGHDHGLAALKARRKRAEGRLGVPA